MTMMLAIRYRKRLGPAGSGGDWDLDTAIVHSVLEDVGWTACGVRIGIGIQNGGRWEKAAHGNVRVNCLRCANRARLHF
jgi:hypothetical protein